MSNPIQGACHCGNIRFDLQWPSSAAEIGARQCGCSFCQKHGGAWTSHPDATLVVKIGDPAGLSKYRFGTETADFYVCSICGIVPFVIGDIDSERYAVVNVNTFCASDDYSISTTPSNFDGEDTGKRLERR